MLKCCEIHEDWWWFFYRLYRHKLRVTLKGPASHPLVALFQEFIFQNLSVSCASSFWVHLSKTDFSIYLSPLIFKFKQHIFLCAMYSILKKMCNNKHASLMFTSACSIIHIPENKYAFICHILNPIQRKSVVLTIHDMMIDILVYTSLSKK